MAVRYQVHFAGTIIEATVTDKASVVDQWVHEVQSMYVGQSIIVGLDCERKPNTFCEMNNRTATLQLCEMNNRTATLQLCVDTKCLILQLFYIDYIPQSIKSFLTDPSVTFVGVEVGDDVSKLRSEYGLNCTTTADIQALAMMRWPMRFYRKPGLKELANEVAGLVMAKPLHVCRSNWEARALSLEQIEYACIDAYASYKIGYKLLKEM